MLKGFHLAPSLKIITNTQATINRKEKNFIRQNQVQPNSGLWLPDYMYENSTLCSYIKQMPLGHLLHIKQMLLEHLLYMRETSWNTSWVWTVAKRPGVAAQNYPPLILTPGVRMA